MADFRIRPLDELFQEMLTEKQTLTSLNGLLPNGITDENTLIQELTDGKVPDFILWLWNSAVSANLTDISTQSGINDINALLLNQILYTPNWYIVTAKAFQYGDTLIKDAETQRYGYVTINESLQIIESCTTRDYANKAILKVRRKDTDILSVDEKTAFESYINKIKELGQQVEVQNFPADELTINMTILYSGDATLTTIQTDVESAINDYIVNLNFDSKFITNDLIDILQNIDGINDPRFDSGEAIDSIGTTISFTHEYTSNAGYMTINPSTPLPTTINYIAQ